MYRYETLTSRHVPDSKKIYGTNSICTFRCLWLYPSLLSLRPSSSPILHTSSRIGVLHSCLLVPFILLFLTHHLASSFGECYQFMISFSLSILPLVCIVFLSSYIFSSAPAILLIRHSLLYLLSPVLETFFLRIAWFQGTSFFVLYFHIYSDSHNPNFFAFQLHIVFSSVLPYGHGKCFLWRAQLQIYDYPPSISLYPSIAVQLNFHQKTSKAS